MANPTRFGEGEARLKAMSEADYPGGVVVDPTPITAGQEVTVFYNGLLGKEGNGQVYLHYGYGRDKDWREVHDMRMEHTGWGWVSDITVQNFEGRLNFCFKDSANNWDNNNGANWSFQIHDGSQRY
ncbi:carbohydrate-binding protein [Pelotomaculum terephthalicicum JT]|uniref:carbohydrate-binding protein n=1 Tax=Pelotomaculum terephthalicicum TaxID=206393 RepID=UPI001F04925F|nr:carbohydrate-binding protein [Pelotomaculum terephthalicicum]MCG9967801.1 carbohydrate-binding protein [Pelotomaculum terephthalicicum JT]